MEKMICFHLKDNMKLLVYFNEEETKSFNDIELYKLGTKRLEQQGLKMGNIINWYME